MPEYSFNTTDGNEQHSGDTNNSQSELQATANVFDDNFLPLLDHWPCFFGSTGGHPQVYDQDQTPVSTDLPQIGNLQDNAACTRNSPADHLWSPECSCARHGAQLDPRYDDSASIMFSGYQYPPADTQGGPSVHNDAPGYDGIGIDIENDHAHTQTALRTSGSQYHHCGGFNHSGDTPSPTSTAATADMKYCPKCETMFSGKWQKTNFNRHFRSKHRGEKAEQYPCGYLHCTKVYSRKDARLKHHRKKHSGPELPVSGGDRRELRPSHSSQGHSSS